MVRREVRRTGWAAALGQTGEVVIAWSAIWLAVVAACALRTHASLAELPELACRFDATQYVQIATHGYPEVFQGRSSIGFLPGYPMAIAAVRWLTGASADTAGVAITVVSGLVGAIVFDRLLRQRGTSDQARRWALAVWLVYPWAFFQYGAMYTEPLFGLLALAAFLALEQRRVWLAAALAVPAALTRPTGLALVAGLTVASIWQETLGEPDGPAIGIGERLRNAPARAFAPLLGLGAYVSLGAYSAVRWGRPLAYFQAQAARTESVSIESLSKVHFASTLLKAGSSPAIALNLLASALAVLGVVVAARVWIRRGEPGYAVFLVALVVLQWTNSNNFTSAGRYMSAAFPAAILVGEWAAGHRRWASAFVAGSGAAMVVLATAFAAGSGYPGW